MHERWGIDVEESDHTKPRKMKVHHYNRWGIPFIKGPYLESPSTASRMTVEVIVVHMDEDKAE
jgi:hypothetical protein